MWNEGIIACPATGEKYKYWAKVYDEGSELYGINEGRISKLEIRKDGKCLYNYDRGLDFDNLDASGRTVYEIILQKYS